MTVIEINVTREQRMLFNAIMNNLKEVGEKSFASIPTELLFVDERFQRTDTRSKSKIMKLARNWNPSKMDALRVVPHPEEARFSVVDGYGRLTANSIRQVPSEAMESEIIMGAPDDPEERLVFEARIFAEQNNETETLKPIQKHKANLLLGDKAAIMLEDICKEYGVEIISTGGGQRKDHKLGSYASAYSVAKVNGSDCLRYIFDVINKAGYDMEANGFSDAMVRALKNVYVGYQRDGEQLVAQFLRERKPAIFQAEAVAKYPKRAYIASALYLQDYLVANGFDTKFTVNGNKITLVA